MKQVARNRTDASEGFLRGSRFLIQDRATVFTEQFRAILKSARRGAAATSGSLAKLECFRRKICSECQRIVFGPIDLLR